MADSTMKRGRVDIISTLPDEVLRHILSFVPTEFAVRTSVLSPRWKHVWCGTPSLCFHGRIPSAASVQSSLSRYTAPKVTNLHLQTNMMIHDTTTYNLLLKFAISRNVENIFLKFPSLGVFLSDFPDFFYINSSLKQLTLQSVFCASALNPRTHVSWTSLERLSLHFCSLSDEAMAKILSGCPVLETLILSSCDEIMVLDLSNSPSVRTLEINNNSRVRGPAQIVAPHLHRLKLIITPDSPCTLVDVTSLTEAKLEILHIFNFSFDITADTFQTMVLNMLEKMGKVENLTFGEDFLQMLSVLELLGVPFPMFKVKTLSLVTNFSEPVNYDGIERVLQNSPELKKLTIHTNDINMVPALPHNSNVCVELSTKPKTLDGW